MKRIAIIGGGISGLSAAFTLEKQRRDGVDVEYVLFESSPRLGGVLVTEHVDGCLVEAGPDSFLTEKPWAATSAANSAWAINSSARTIAIAKPTFWSRPGWSPCPTA